MNTIRRKQGVKAVIALVVGGLYLLNPTAGVVELLRDVFPIVGTLVLYGARELRGSPRVLSVN